MAGEPQQARPAPAAQFVSPEVQQNIAQAISMGLTPMPTTPQGWQALASQYAPGSIGAGSLQAAPGSGTAAAQARPGSIPGEPSAPSPLGTPGVSPSPAATTSGDLKSFLNAIKQHESGGNYTAYNAKGGASGAYQFIQSTWSNAAKEAGYQQYAGGPASAAPAAVQDAVAGHMAQSYFNHYGSWSDAAQAWYDPALVGKNVVPAPGAGNTESVTAYGQQIVDMMAQAGTPADYKVNSVQGGTTPAIAYARQAIGTQYVWGGGNSSGPSKGIGGDPQDPNAAYQTGFDCSGLVQAAYAKSGVKLPRTAQQQYDQTMKVPNGSPLQAGDLVFFGSGPNDISHVGIYIGNNQMIDAPHSGAQVRVENYQWGDFVGATRPGDPTGATVVPPAPLGQKPNTPQQAQSDYQQNLALVRNALTRMGVQ
jgi:cell wall-associated NlpC family hydrolase